VQLSRIVVGVDGSESSRQALLWAVEQASLRGSTIDVIHTYEPSVQGLEGVSSATEAEKVVHGARNAAQALVDSMLAGLEDVEASGKAIESTNAAQTLVEHSKDAEMLVVSSRGRGTFKSLMLGSVSHQCAIHAECPVVIIRSRADKQNR
jgi:nucleotide-binding universal stress UspA family protein